MRYILKKGMKIGAVYDTINCIITNDIKNTLDEKKSGYSKKEGCWTDYLQKTFIIDIKIKVKQG